MVSCLQKMSFIKINTFVLFSFVDPSQAYITSPLTTTDGTLELHSNPFLENVTLETVADTNSFDHITVLRIGTPNNGSPNYSGSVSSPGPANGGTSPSSCRIYGNGRLVGSTLKQSPSFREAMRSNHYESYNPRLQNTSRPQSALVMSSDMSGSHASSGTLPTTITGNRTLISTEYVSRSRTLDSSNTAEQIKEQHQQPLTQIKPKCSSFRTYRELPRVECDSPEASQNLATTSTTSASSSSFSTSFYSLSPASTPSSSVVNSPTCEEAPPLIRTDLHSISNSSEVTSNCSHVPPVISVTTSSSSCTSSSSSSSSGLSSSHASQSTVILRAHNKNKNTSKASSSLDDPTDEDEMVTLTEDSDLQTLSTAASQRAKLPSESFMTVSRL